MQGVRAIVDAIEQTNFTIKQVGLLSNDTRVSAGDDIEEVQETRDREEIQAEERALAHHVHQRLPVLLERNRFLTRRVKRAATRVIGPARMLLNARPMSDHEIARRMISTGPTIPFRILDLPREVLYNIVRQCSRDPTALSEAQFARIRAEAEDGESLGRLRRMTRLRSEEEASQGDEWVKWEIREDWLRRGRWDKWELDQPVAPFGVVT